MYTLSRAIAPIVGLLNCGRTARTSRSGGSCCGCGRDGNNVSGASVTVCFSPHILMAGATLKGLLRQGETLLGVSVG